MEILKPAAIKTLSTDEGGFEFVENEKEKAQGKKANSLSDFLEKKKFSSVVETVMGVAYYLIYVEHVDCFTARDILNAMEIAHWPAPHNVWSGIRRNRELGRMQLGKERRDGENTYQVLEAGRRWCEQYHPASVVTTKKRSKKGAILKPSASILKITREELHLTKYCDPLSAKKLKEQLLMVMYICIKEKGIHSFTVVDLMTMFANLFQEQVSLRRMRYAINHGEWEFEGKNRKKAIYYTLTRDGMEAAERLIAKYKIKKEMI